MIERNDNEIELAVDSRDVFQIFPRGGDKREEDDGGGRFACMFLLKVSACCVIAV
jgi:hypothetical protein